MKINNLKEMNKLYGAYQDLIKILGYITEAWCNHAEILDKDQYTWHSIDPQEVKHFKEKTYGPIKAHPLYPGFSQTTVDYRTALKDIRDMWFKRPSYIRLFIDKFLEYNNANDENFNIPPYDWCIRNVKVKTR